MSYDQETESWNEKILVGGADIFDPDLASLSAVNGLWLFSLILVAIWSAVISGRKHDSTQSIANLYMFWIALSIAIIHYTFSFTMAMITQFGAWIRASYLVVDLIFNSSFGILGGICLLVAIYYLISRLHRQIGNAYDNDKRTLLWAHLGFCGILAIFYLAMFGIQMRDLYESIFHPDTYGGLAEYKGIPDLGIVLVTYNALYLCAALEILAASLWLLKQGIQMHTRKTPGFLLLCLISMPLLMRSTFDLAVNIATFILQNFNVTFGTIIALYVFDGLCWMLAFIGIVLISRQDSSSPTPTPFDTEKSMPATTAGGLIADKSGSSSN